MLIDFFWGIHSDFHGISWVVNGCLMGFSWEFNGIYEDLLGFFNGISQMFMGLGFSLLLEWVLIGFHGISIGFFCGRMS